MNRSLLFILIALFITGITFFTIIRKKNTSTEKTYRIAIFEPASHPAMDEISRGVIETMQQNGKNKYVFDRYNANGNQTLLRAQAEEIIQNNYDLIIPIGTGCTQTVYELTKKKGFMNPIVFTAVANPTNLGIIKSMQSSGNNVTGVEDIDDINQQLTELLILAPHIKNIIFAYNPTAQAGQHDKMADKIQQLLNPKDIQLTRAKVFHTNELQAKIQPMLSGSDVLLIRTDHTTVSGIDVLITLCNRYGVILYASDLNSGDKGAALSFGVVERDLGVKAADIALEILETNKKPTDIPIFVFKANKIKINTKTMKQQKLLLSDEQLEAFKKQGGLVI